MTPPLQNLEPDVRRQLAELLTSFAACWNANTLMVYVRHLQMNEPLARQTALQELVKIDMQKRWELSQPAFLEFYLEALPELGDTAGVVPALVLHEYRLRQKCHHPVEVGEYAQRFPAQTESFRHLLADAAGVTEVQAQESTYDPVPPPPVAPVPTQPSRSRESLQLGTFGRYRILSLLGRGSMGEVYLAHDTQLDRKVALKIPSFRGDGPERLQRFYQEARVASTLHHTGLCPVYDVGEVAGTPFMTMAYIEGRPLTELIRERKAFPLREAAELARKMAAALAEAHRCSVIHRDLKPSNIMVDRRAEPIIMDFGLARRFENEDIRLTQQGVVIGTPAYMAPEMANGLAREAGPAVDIYSLGVILYELLTGRLPFRGSLQTVLAQLLIQPPVPPSTLRAEIDAELEQICLTALAKHAEERFATMNQFEAALAHYLRSAPVAETLDTVDIPNRLEKPPVLVPAVPHGQRRLAARTRRRQRALSLLWLLVLGVLVAVLSCSVVLLLLGKPGEGTRPLSAP